AVAAQPPGALPWPGCSGPKAVLSPHRPMPCPSNFCFASSTAEAGWSPVDTSTLPAFEPGVRRNKEPSAQQANPTEHPKFSEPHSQSELWLSSLATPLAAPEPATDLTSV